MEKEVSAIERIAFSILSCGQELRHLVTYSARCRGDVCTAISGVTIKKHKQGILLGLVLS